MLLSYPTPSQTLGRLRQNGRHDGKDYQTHPPMDPFGDVDHPAFRKEQEEGASSIGEYYQYQPERSQKTHRPPAQPVERADRKSQIAAKPEHAQAATRGIDNDLLFTPLQDHPLGLDSQSNEIEKNGIRMTDQPAERIAEIEIQTGHQR
jgi:hypothetical protein